MNTTKIDKGWPQECEAKNCPHLHRNNASKGPKLLKLGCKEQKSLCKGLSLSALDSPSIGAGNWATLYPNRSYQNQDKIRNQTCAS